MNGRWSAMILILVGLATGCGSGGTGTESSDLFGTWQLTRAVGGIAGGERREALTVTIKRDGTAVFQSDSTGTSTRRFHIGQGNGCVGDKIVPILDYDSNGKPNQAVVEVTKTRLVLTDACISDGFTEEYERIAP
jgi:hypothetical protein